jgi:hypothetical protein
MAYQHDAGLLDHAAEAADAAGWKFAFAGAPPRVKIGVFYDRSYHRQ